MQEDFRNQHSTLKGISCLICFIFALCFPSFAADKISIVAIKSSNASAYNIALAGFTNSLKQQGVDFNLIEYEISGKTNEEVAQYIKEIQGNKINLFFTLGTSAARMIQSAVKGVPIVFCMVLNPLQSGISIPGVSLDISMELKLRKIKSIMPQASRVGLFYSDNSTSARDEIAQLCNQLGLTLVDKKVALETEFNDALRDIAQKIDYFLMIADSNIYFPKAVEYLLREGLNNKFAVVGLSSVYTKAGALLSFDCDYNDIGAQAAELAMKILHGQAADNVKFVMPRKINFSLNLKVAELLGIKLPAGVAQEASEVFGR